LAAKYKKTQPKIMDVLGVDFGSTSTKLVRIRSLGGKLSLVDADVMPAIELEGPAADHKLNIPKKLNAPYVAAALTGQDSHVRFMFIASKLHDGRAIQQRVAKSLSLSREFRVGYSIVEKGKEELDHKVLAAGIPGQELQTVRNLFASNHPSLISMEIAGLSALNSFSHTPAVQEAEGIVCYLEAGASSLFISFFLDGELRLVRKFDHGSVYIQRRIQDVLNINEDDALTVLFEDANPLLDQALDPISTMTQEISISCKFVERNENSRIQHVYASGGLSYSPYWTFTIAEIMGVEVEVWNPFLPNGIRNYPKGVYGVESMFSPAVGAALALLKPSS
jgi:Tfp pilus assembly PilM family ATPase